MTETLSGMEVVTSVWLTEAGDPVEVKRTWRERLFSRPWHPFRRTRTVVPQVPSRKVIQVGNRLIVHPAMLASLRALK